MWACSACQTSFTTKLQFKNHLYYAHVPKEEWRYKCKALQRCEETFIYAKNLKVHIHDEHPNVYKLTNFEKNWSDKYTNNKIPQMFKLQCVTCKLMFNSQKLLDTHKLGHIKYNDRKYECKFCYKKFYKQIFLDYHLNIHNNIKPFKCDTNLKN